MFIKGDHVVITANDTRRGQTGVVAGEKTAVEINGEIEFYKPKELDIARNRIPVRRSLQEMAAEVQI